MKINFTTNVRTKKFSSVDELPPDLREIYEQARAGGGGKFASTGPKISTRLVINGHEVESNEKVSELEEKLCTDVLQLLKGAGATTTGHLAELPAQSAPTAASSPALAEAGWLTKKQRKLVLLVIVLAAVALALALALNLSLFVR